jgi:outer membrane protein assembly factor BamB
MRTLIAALLVALIQRTPLCAQRTAIDSPFAAVDAQRTGWEKSDSVITKQNVKDFQLLTKMVLDPNVKGGESFSPPVVLGRLISYKGFKELAFLQNANGSFWAIDVDTNRLFWQKHLEKSPDSAACSFAVPAQPALMPTPSFGRPAPGTPAAPPPPKTILSQPIYGGSRPLFAISGDGKLHLLNTSTGDDAVPAIQFLPPGAKASNLTEIGDIVYTTTNGNCGGAPNAVWAIDFRSEAHPTYTFNTGGPIRGVTFAPDGTVFAQTPDSLTALTPDLKPTEAFRAPLAHATPVVFTWQNRELIAVAGEDRIYLLDPKSLKTPLSEIKTTGVNNTGLSSWQDPTGVRYVVAPNQKITAYRITDVNGVPTLVQAWQTRDLKALQAPVITSGIVFALSSGTHATLQAFDGATGAELYTTADQVTAHANFTGMTLANGRIFFTTTDGTLYAFGVPLER